MKKIALISLFALCNAFAFGQKTNSFVEEQSSVPPTTEEEYNYMTKGYKVQVESGLDMKKGYVMEDTSPIIRGNYEFTVKFLKRESTNQLAGVLIVAKSNVSGNSYYMGLPINNSELLTRYYSNLSQWDRAMLLEYTFVTSSLFAHMSGGYYELENSK